MPETILSEFMVKRFFIQIHKILGLPLSFVFLIWFLSGFVMIFNGTFPKARNPYKHSQALPANAASDLQPIDSLLAQLPDSTTIRGISVSMTGDRPVAQIETRDTTFRFYADEANSSPIIDREFFNTIASTWCKGNIEKVDTLTNLDQWIPFERLEKELPIYKYTFNNPQRHELYITNQGEVVQFSNSDQRFWAKIGAIPHWFYYTALKKHDTLWTNTIEWLALLGCIMCITGFAAAIMIWAHDRKKHGFFHNPFKKFWLKWHFTTGMLFGLFAITFAFSGYMSMTDIPQWMKKTPQGMEQNDHKQNPGRFADRSATGKSLNTEKYHLDYRKLLADGSVKCIEWKEWEGHPYYKVSRAKSSENINADDTTSIGKFKLTEEIILAHAKKNIPDSINFSIDRITEFDEDYFSRGKKMSPLPAYRVILDDYLNTRYYYADKTLTIRKIDDNDRTRRLLYSGMHRLHFKFLYEHRWLWYTIMFTIMIGGTALSITGVALTFKWMCRCVRHKKKCHKH